MLKWRNHIFYYVTLQVENIVGKKQKVGKERMRERGNRVRGSVRLRKGCSISHKLDHWPNSLELRDN